MVIYPARHLFEAKFPTLEDHEEEVFYQHPIFPVKCNQIGVLYYECEDDFVMYEKNNTFTITYKPTAETCGSKLRVVWECYTGVQAKGAHFHFVNGNPYDHRYENLLLSRSITRKESEKSLRVKRAFAKASLEHLLKVESKMEKIGFTQTDTWEILKIPYWLKVERRDYMDAPLVPGKSRRGGTISKTTEAEKAEVCELFKAGWTYTKIVAHMDWGSTTRVKKVVRDLGLTR